MTVEEILTRLDKVKKNGSGWVSRCPAHEDRNPSLSVTEGADNVLLHCFAGCDIDAITAALGIKPYDLFHNNNGAEPRRLIATHPYHDVDGKHLFDIRRYSSGEKCLPYLPGAERAGIGKTPRPLYRLPLVAAAVRNGDTVYVTEGESDADAMEKAGVIATTNPFGAGKWLPQHTEALKGAHVVIVQDKDEPGRKHAQNVLDALTPLAKSVQLFEPLEGNDARDHLRAGHTVAELVKVSSVSLSEKDATEENKSPVGLPFKTLGEALADTPEQIEWIWHGCIAAGTKTLFASKPKLGKSTTTFGLLRELTAGSEFLGLTVAPTSVLLLSEEPASALREKAVRFGLDVSSVASGPARQTEETSGPSVHLLRRSQALGVTWAEVVDQAVTYAVENGIGVLVIDTLDKWAGFRGDDENKTGALLEVMEPVERAVAAGLAVLIITHHRKSGGEYGEGVRGGNALTGAVDVVLELERLPQHVDESRHGRILRGSPGLRTPRRKSFSGSTSPRSNCWGTSRR